MAIAGFDELGKGVAELAGVALPAHGQSGQDMPGLTVHMHGVAVSMMEWPGRCPDTVFLVAPMGVPAQEQAPGGWLELLDENLGLDVQRAPVFSRNARTGEVLLQWVGSFQEISAVDVYRRIEDMALLANRWKRDGQLGGLRRADNPGLLADGQAADKARAVRASVAFSEAYASLCEATGQTAAGLPDDCGMRGFPLAVDGVQVFVFHFSHRDPDMVYVTVPLTAAEPAGGQDMAARLLEANFSLLPHPHRAMFCRDAASGTFLLQGAYPLVGLAVAQFLDKVSAWTRLARVWEPSDGASRPADAQTMVGMEKDRV